MAHYKRSNARKLAREKAKKDFYHIVDTTSSTYGKKGNVNSMNICSNVTKSKYGDETVLRHYRRTVGASAEYINLLR